MWASGTHSRCLLFIRKIMFKKRKKKIIITVSAVRQKLDNIYNLFPNRTRFTERSEFLVPNTASRAPERLSERASGSSSLSHVFHLKAQHGVVNVHAWGRRGGKKDALAPISKPKTSSASTSHTKPSCEGQRGGVHGTEVQALLAHYFLARNVVDALFSHSDDYI